MKDRLGATDPRSMAMRFHTQTAGSSLTAQQPYNNVVRTAYQALAAVLGGTQSLHTNSFDEALGLPTEESATLALRTQQILAAETGVADTVDPLAGSYFIEALTDELEKKALEILDAVDQLGGAVAAIEAGYPQRQIEDAAYRYARDVEDGSRTIVGVNAYVADDEPSIPVLKVDPELEPGQVAATRGVRAARSERAVEAALVRVEAAARSEENLLYPMRDALEAMATVGEVSGVLRSVFGRYRPAG